MARCQTRKDAAKEGLDAELGVSKKYSEFQQRLSKIRQSTQSEFNQLMDQYRDDWETFKGESKRSFDKAQKAGKESFNFLEAKLDGLSARVQYLAGLAKAQDARSAEKINRSHEVILNGLKALSDEVRSAFREKRLESEDAMAAYDQKLQQYSQKAEKTLLKWPNREETKSATKH